MATDQSRVHDMLLLRLQVRPRQAWQSPKSCLTPCFRWHFFQRWDFFKDRCLDSRNEGLAKDKCFAYLHVDYLILGLQLMDRHEVLLLDLTWHNFTRVARRGQQESDAIVDGTHTHITVVVQQSVKKRERRGSIIAAVWLEAARGPQNKPTRPQRPSTICCLQAMYSFRHHYISSMTLQNHSWNTSFSSIFIGITISSLVGKYFWMGVNYWEKP